MSNVQGIRLEQDFGVTGEHLGTIVEHFGPQLQSLELGDSESGVQASSCRLHTPLTSATPAMQPGLGATAAVTAGLTLGQPDGMSLARSLTAGLSLQVTAHG